MGYKRIPHQYKIGKFVREDIDEQEAAEKILLLEKPIRSRRMKNSCRIIIGADTQYVGKECGQGRQSIYPGKESPRTGKYLPGIL